MNIHLAHRQEQAIQAAIEAGRFRPLEEFIESAVRTARLARTALVVKEGAFAVRSPADGSVK